MATPAHSKADEFLRVAPAFRLGNLPTEQRHPATLDLARQAREDIPAALASLREIELHVARTVASNLPELARLDAAVRGTLAAGGRVFLYGCGATGRLSLSVEHLWRSLHPNDPAAADRAQGFMSGGDLALVHSIENFEDHPEYGARQLREIGFREGDLLVSCTEGGETPSVIGATEEACRLSRVNPFFLYCNPDAVLAREVERSKRVLENPRIEKICLYVGEMSLSGSTRLQASTALQLATGWALATNAGHVPGPLAFSSYIDLLTRTDFSFLRPFIEEESRIYGAGDFVLYETDAYGITILTDTTERAPTFSLLGFENQGDPERRPSLSFLSLPSAPDAAAAWRDLLLRAPIALEWPELQGVASAKRLMGFDFSRHARAQREALVAPAQLHTFRITREGPDMVFSLNGAQARVKVAGLHPMHEQLFLKVALNMHSTLVMGRLGRFESNVMTWVRPSNNKLIDRTIRYVQHLLKHRGLPAFGYEEIARQCFEEIARLEPNESVVLKTVAALALRANAK